MADYLMMYPFPKKYYLKYEKDKSTEEKYQTYREKNDIFIGCLWIISSGRKVILNVSGLFTSITKLWIESPKKVRIGIKKLSKRTVKISIKRKRKILCLINTANSPTNSAAI